jgi:hypothetical protein
MRNANFDEPWLSVWRSLVRFSRLPSQGCCIVTSPELCGDQVIPDVLCQETPAWTFLHADNDRRGLCDTHAKEFRSIRPSFFTPAALGGYDAQRLPEKVAWEYYFDPECETSTCQHARYYAMGDEKPVSCPVRKRRKNAIT